jgi:DNA uptake protein ComE-like DNA-binding protein
LQANDYTTIVAINTATEEELEELDNVGPATVRKLKARAGAGTGQD